jgi:transcriptional regulator with XRE-family HTH domain
MSTVELGSRVAHTKYDPEDIRVGETLKALMFRDEETPEGFIIRRPVRHDELAQAIRLPGKTTGVHRSYISQICSGRHLNNDMLYAIARYLGVNPIAIKRPDSEQVAA